MNTSDQPSNPYVEELRLTRFKSFVSAALPLRELTLLIGRNGSGKSNCIDALHVLSRLAGGEDIREAIGGSRREGGEVRGGPEGCAPYGDSSFELGCTIWAGGDRIALDIEIQVAPDVQIVKEHLVRRRGGQQPRNLLITDQPSEGLSDINARYYNGKRGIDPAIPFRATRLLASQVATKVPTARKEEREVHEAADLVVSALEGIFILDPIPHLMRQYVPEKDISLRRQADNLSAVVGAMRADSTKWKQLEDLVRSLTEQEINKIDVESSPLGDVILALWEVFGEYEAPFSARVMSDGMLRFVAFAAALLEAPLQTDAAERVNHTLLVIEEVENGLHPSQAARVVELIASESRRRLIRTLATTHSPAILTALDSRDHRGVVICRRDAETARSTLTSLVDLPAYADAMASGSLGDAVTRGVLDHARTPTDRVDAVDRLLASL